MILQGYLQPRHFLNFPSQISCDVFPIGLWNHCTSPPPHPVTFPWLTRHVVTGMLGGEVPHLKPKNPSTPLVDIHKTYTKHHKLWKITMFSWEHQHHQLFNYGPFSSSQTVRWLEEGSRPSSHDQKRWTWEPDPKAGCRWRNPGSCCLKRGNFATNGPGAMVPDKFEMLFWSAQF